MGWLSRFTSRPGTKPGDPATTAEVPRPACRFVPPRPVPASGRYLEIGPGPSAGALRYPLVGAVEIGRDEDGRELTPGLLLVRDPSVSFRHCVITQRPDGSTLVRDLSRNGTRLDGRRLVPNVETEMKPGQALDLGAALHFVLKGDVQATATQARPARGRTETAPQLSLATVLVGDIRDYTVLVRRAPSAQLQQSVNRVFETLSAAVVEHGGTVKEFPGDAILAFWEGSFRGRMALSACRAAIALDQVARRIANDPSIWALADFPLRMDWALATGEVSIDSFGGDTPVGLSMIGEPVVLACRIEKFATDATGPILTDPNTREMVGRALRDPGPNAASDAKVPPLQFIDLGEMQAKGFDRPDHVFALKVADG